MCIIRGCIFFFFMSNLRRFQRVTRMWATSWGWPCLTELTSTSLGERGRVDLRRWKTAGSHLMRYHYPNRHPTEIRPDFPCCADMVWLDEYKCTNRITVAEEAITECKSPQRGCQFKPFRLCLALENPIFSNTLYILRYKLSCQNSHFFLKKWLNRHVRPNVVSSINRIKSP